MNIGRIPIGTSGWHYPHWVGPFYPSGMASEEFLPFYARHFGTVEINNTFYQLPALHTLREWGKEIPHNFLFTSKGSRFIAHIKKLKDPEHSIARFFETITVLRHKLGPILFQLPPRWRMNVSRWEEFLKALPTPFRRHPGPILGKWNGQTLRPEGTLAFQTAESADCPFTAFFATLPSSQKGLLEVLFPGRLAHRNT